MPAAAEKGTKFFSDLVLLSALRTGDPFLDSLIVLFFSSILGYLTETLANVWTLISTKSSSKIYIERYEKKFYSHRNRIFESMQWYLSKQFENETASGRPRLIGDIQAIQLCESDPILLTAAKDSIHSLYHDGEKIEVNYVFKQQMGQNEMITVKEYYTLTYFGRKDRFLADFIKHVVFTHRKYVKDADWKQRMWTLERSENKLEWESYKTGNTKQFFNIIMERSQRDALERDVDKFLNGKKEYKRRGVPWRRGYLFHGEPGCGKTSLILAITNAAKMDIYCMDLSMFRDDQELRNMFRKIPSKSAIVFEDIDALSDVVKKRKEPPPPPPVSLPISNADLSHMKGTLLANVINGMPKNAITLSALLNELDGIASCHGKILIMTTNALESLDGALVRPGRIDYKMELGRATREEIAMAFELYLNRTVDAEKLPKELDRKYTVAQVCNMIVTGELDEKIER